MYLARIIWTYHELKEEGLSPKALFGAWDVCRKVGEEIQETKKNLTQCKAFRYYLPILDNLPDRLEPMERLKPTIQTKAREVEIDQYTFANDLILGLNLYPQISWPSGQWGFLLERPNGIGYEFAGQKDRFIVEPFERWSI